MSTGIMISESKLDYSFPDGQFLIESYGEPFWLDLNKLGGGIILFVRSDIPAKLLSVDITCQNSLSSWTFKKSNDYKIALITLKVVISSHIWTVCPSL